MTDQEKLEALLQKAIDGGWELPHEAYDWEVRPNDMIRFTSIDDETQDPGTWYMPLEQLIFNHEFAKALFGDEPGLGAIPGYIDDAPNWQYHLMLAVVSDNPIDYMYQAVFGKVKGSL